MKLSTARLYYNLPILFIVLVISTFLFAVFIQHSVEKNVSEVINIRKDYIVNQLKMWNGDESILEKYAINNVYQIDRIDNKYHRAGEISSDTSIYDQIHNEHILYRQINFIFSKNDKTYSVYVRKALVDYHSIIKTVFTWITIESLVLIGLLTLINSTISKRIMSPFYRLLNNLKNFNLDKQSEIKPVQTRISEFQELNDTLTDFTQKLKEQYNDLKDFTSHLTHELQTPLAVIAAHTDMLTQDENLTEEQLKYLGIIQRTIESMRKFEDALIFLKRIELGEFTQSEMLDIKTLLTEKLDELDELFKLRNLSVDIKLESSFKLYAHPQLLETLLNNLISNAMRHNYENGSISIRLYNRTLVIKNTFRKHHSIQATNTEDKIYKRGLGLGLNIIKTICSKYYFELHQHTEDGYYISTIHF